MEVLPIVAGVAVFVIIQIARAAARSKSQVPQLPTVDDDGWTSSATTAVRGQTGGIGTRVLKARPVDDRPFDEREHDWSEAAAGEWEQSIADEEAVTTHLHPEASPEPEPENRSPVKAVRHGDPTRPALLRNRQSLRRAILAREILGPPKALEG